MATIPHTSMQAIATLCAVWALAALFLILCVACVIAFVTAGGLLGLAGACFFAGALVRCLADPFLHRHL